MDSLPPSAAIEGKLEVSRLVNDQSQPHEVDTSNQETGDRNDTYNAIKSSMGPRKEPIDLEVLQLGESAPPKAPTPSQPRSSRQYEEVPDSEIADLDFKAASRDVRDQAPLTPPATSRSISPVIGHPAIDFDGLSWPSAGTLDRLRERESPQDAEARLAKLSGAVRTILECIGEDPDREGLHGTPERYAKAMMFFTKGYEENLRDIVNGAVFHEDHEELVIVKDIEVYSLCEHHLVPFTGKVGHAMCLASRISTDLSRCTSATYPLEESLVCRSSHG